MPRPGDCVVILAPSRSSLRWQRLFGVGPQHGTEPQHHESTAPRRVRMEARRAWPARRANHHQAPRCPLDKPSHGRMTAPGVCVNENEEEREGASELVILSAAGAKDLEVVPALH